MKVINKFSLLFLPILSLTLSAQTPETELEKLEQNFINSLVANSEQSASLVELLSGIKPETEVSDQIVVELHQRYPFNTEQIKSYVETIREDGSWPDINYADDKRSGWDLKRHADRVLELAKLYKAEGSSCSWGPKIEAVIHSALGYWFREKPVCKNWWYNEIGIPKTFGLAFLLFAERMTPDEKQAAVDLMKQARFGMTGQNKVWLAGNVLMRGLLEADYDLVKAARDTIVSEIVTGQTEGIKSDWSFHQHGPQQQFGNYGLAYLSEMAAYSGLFAGTAFALNKDQQEILNRFLLEGYRWIVWRGYLDVNGLDRQLFHNAQLHKAFSMAFSANALMRGSTPAEARQMEELIQDNYQPGQPGSRFTGHKHFWDSDQTIHRSPSWMASVKMASDRVIGTEQVNEDNLKGFYMGDGALYTYRRGDEYLNVFPFWDWRMIPGITSYDTSDPVPAPKAYGAHVRNRTSFVGGVTDGKRGMTAMVLDRDGLQARKSWIFTDNYILCLGAGIHSDSLLAISTNIDQRMKHGELLCYENNKWTVVKDTYTPECKALRFFHDSTGYVLLQPETCVAIVEKRSGRWSDFMGSYEPKTVEGNVISLSIKHDKSKPATYQYAVLPAASAEETAAFPSEGVRIIRNDENMQAVATADVYYITAYEPGEVRLAEGLDVRFGSPGIYMLRPENGALHIEAADPTHALKSLSLAINNQPLTLVFPAGHEPGKSLSVTPVIHAPFTQGIQVDGNKGDWKSPSGVAGLIAPWDGVSRDDTKFYVCRDDKKLYFLYEVEDSTLIFNDEKTEASVGKGDRIEFFFSKDPELSTYYCAEIDPKGKIMDYRAEFYRKFDFSWNFKSLKLGTQVEDNRYCVEGSISLKELKALGVISPAGEIRMGIYRADYYGSQEEQVVWSSWIVPDAAEPDFHIPSSFGILKMERF